MSARVKSDLEKRDRALRAELRQGLPDSFRQTQPIKRPFDHVRDPLISAQIKAMEKTEAQRREESSGRGSTMVRLHKPFPELRPKHQLEPMRSAFNQAWLREQREAALAQLDIQQQRRKQSQDHHAKPDRPIGHER